MSRPRIVLSFVSHDQGALVQGLLDVAQAESDSIDPRCNGV